MLKIKIPIKTVSEANKREHWSKPYRRAKKQKDTLKYMLGHAIMNEAPELLKIRPLYIKLIRIAPRSLDTGDNLNTSLKACKDGVAEIFNPGLAPGRADDDPELIWDFDQKKGNPKEYAVEIEISETPSEAPFNI